MHELVLAESALQLALAEMRRQNAAAITSIALRVGERSGADPDALEFALSALLAQSVAAGARINIERVPAVACCRACGATFPVPLDQPMLCPACGHGRNLQLTAGRELELARIEIRFSHDASPVCS